MNQRYNENLELLKNPQVQAMLYTIAKSEGTLDASGNIEYGRIVKGTVISSPFNKSLIGQKNVVITDFSRHPQIMVQVNKTVKSSAAGFLQALYRTWKTNADKLGITDFSPLSQQIIAVELLRQRGALNYILQGDLKGAFSKTSLGLEWASFPNNNYGQGGHTADKLQGWFDWAKTQILGGNNLLQTNLVISAGLSVGMVLLILGILYVVT